MGGCRCPYPPSISHDDTDYRHRQQDQQRLWPSRRADQRRSWTNTPEICGTASGTGARPLSHRPALVGERPANTSCPASDWLLHLLDVGNEAIAAPRHCLDVLRRTLLVAERLPECEHVVRQIAFFDVAVGPDELQKLVLMQQAAGIFDQHSQQLEALGRERNRLAVGQQSLLLQSSRNGPNSYKLLIASSLGRFQKSSRTLSETLENSHRTSPHAKRSLGNGYRRGSRERIVAPPVAACATRAASSRRVLRRKHAVAEAGHHRCLCRRGDVARLHDAGRHSEARCRRACAL